MELVVVLRGRLGVTPGMAVVHSKGEGQSLSVGSLRQLGGVVVLRMKGRWTRGAKRVMNFILSSWEARSGSDWLAGERDTGSQGREGLMLMYPDQVT